MLSNFMSEDKKSMCSMYVSDVSVAGFDLPARKWHEALALLNNK
jgi:hypothetical protein